MAKSAYSPFEWIARKIRASINPSGGAPIPGVIPAAAQLRCERCFSPRKPGADEPCGCLYSSCPFCPALRGDIRTACSHFLGWHTPGDAFMDGTLLSRTGLPRLANSDYGAGWPLPSNQEFAAAFGELAHVVEEVYCDDLREPPDPQRLLHMLVPHVPEPVRWAHLCWGRERTLYYAEHPEVVRQALLRLTNSLEQGFAALDAKCGAGVVSSGLHTPRASRIRQQLVFASGAAYTPIQL